MNLAISNIAWDKSNQEEVYKLMQNRGYTGLEIAPTKIWDDIDDISDSDIKSFLSLLEKYQIRPISMQSLLYGHPELQIFKSREEREATLNHLKKCILLASKLNVSTVIFGSPKNRQTNDLPRNEVDDIAFEFFSKIGQISKDNNVVFCIEANPKEYGTDFINTTYESIGLVKKINLASFRVHLDTGTFFLNDEDIVKTIVEASSYVSHVHISEPYLNSVANMHKQEHLLISRELAKLNYNRWISIEMKQTDSFNLSDISNTLDYVREIYDNK